MDRKIIDYLPDYMKEYREFQSITDAVQLLLKELYDKIYLSLDNNFLADADKEGIARYEKILKIVPTESSLLEARRFKVQSSFLDYSNYTLYSLKQYLDSILGNDGYEVELQSRIYTLVVKIKLSEKYKFDVVMDYFKKNVPANIIINAYILFNLNSSISRFTHKQLQKWSHNYIRSEVF